MQYGSKSAGLRLRLSVTEKLPYMVRAYEALTASRFISCCSTPALARQLYPRLNHPFVKSGLATVVFSLKVATLGLLYAPHTSPPRERRSCAAGFARSQSG